MLICVDGFVWFDHITESTIVSAKMLTLLLHHHAEKKFINYNYILPCLTIQVSELLLYYDK